MMNPFAYRRVHTPETAVHAIAQPGTKVLAGGTNLIDLMKCGVEQPSALVDISPLEFGQVSSTPEGGVWIGATVRNSDLANHELIRKHYPLLSQALLSGASPQLRNMATTGGNLMQRTRCYYFMDKAFPACNKRAPGSGCSAVEGFNRIHAILGQTDHGPTSSYTCIATNPSDMSVALCALNASIHVRSLSTTRVVPISEFHRLPGSTPRLDTTLRREELITGVSLPPAHFAANSYYLKVRDRGSYAFALVSVAAGLELVDGEIRSAGLALGGVAHKPWRSSEAERALAGARPSVSVYRDAARLMLTGARGYEHNRFKIQLAEQAIVKALSEAARSVSHASQGDSK
jgi:xanthine dehydrogenase YagS FAD-binding subunit